MQVVPATNQVMPSEPTMVMMNTSLPAVVTATPTVGATSIAGATFIAAAAINEGRANSIQESGDEGKGTIVSYTFIVKIQHIKNTFQFLNSRVPLQHPSV